MPKKNIIFSFITFIFLTTYSYIFAILLENPFSFSRLITASFFYSILINCLFVQKNLNIKEINYARTSIFFGFITCIFLKIMEPFLPEIWENQGFGEPTFANLFIVQF